MELLIQIFAGVLIIAGTLMTILGTFTMLMWFKTPALPSDQSNRINNITSWWIGLTRPEVLAPSYEFFKKDVYENIKNKESVK